LSAIQANLPLTASRLRAAHSRRAWAGAFRDRLRDWNARRQDHAQVEPDEFGNYGGETLRLRVGVTFLQHEIAAFDIAELAQALPKAFKGGLFEPFLPIQM
jgi:hypothetical protein